MFSRHYWRTPQSRLDIEEASRCPVCNGSLQFMEASFLCPVCGYSQEDHYIKDKFYPPY